MRKIEYIVTGEEMQEYDKNTVSCFHVPELLLMEQAALAATEEMIKLFPNRSKKVLILAGTGNNGADAMAVARLLSQKGYPIQVCMVSNKEVRAQELGNSARIQYEMIQNMGIPMVTELSEGSYDILVDGIFGVGLNREITGKIYDIIRKINGMTGCKIALDIPSGICATTGKIQGIAFRADYSITFAFIKRGLCLYPGASYAGKVIKKEIGITEESFQGNIPRMYALTGNVKEYLPARSSSGHKGTFGKILLVAGSSKVGGAAILAGQAAFLSGCGMLRICTHKNHKMEIMMLLPEAMTDVYETKEEAEETVKQGMAWADVIAMGPGMGTDDIASALLEQVMEGSQKPLVLDADGLNLLSVPRHFQRMVEKQKNPESRRRLVLTPHPLELARMMGKTIEEQGNHSLEFTNSLAEKLHAVIVKKDARTIICKGNDTYALNLCGNSGMATAGSGDVLTGIIASMLAVCKCPFEAAVVGVYLHGKAGDNAKEKKNEYSLLAQDISRSLIEVLK